MVRLLATEFDDTQIARVLNKQGRRTGKGNPFTAHKVALLRNRNGIAVFPRHKARDPTPGSLHCRRGAAELGVCSVDNSALAARWALAWSAAGSRRAMADRADR
jgi:hypothetical protein